MKIYQAISIPRQVFSCFIVFLVFGLWKGIPKVMLMYVLITAQALIHEHGKFNKIKSNVVIQLFIKLLNLQIESIARVS